MKGITLNPRFHRPRSDEPTIPSIEPGNFYDGVVVDTMPARGLVTVRVTNPQEDLTCVWAAGIMSSLLGFKLSYCPPIKSKVQIYYTGLEVSLIVAAIPEQPVDPGKLTRSIADPTGDAYTQLEFQKSKGIPRNASFIGHKPPIDMVEGEINLDNLAGVGLSLLRYLSSIQAGDLARVECHLMDDMVRIMSDKFRHHTSFGDLYIFNDGGKLNHEWHGTSLDYESWGLVKPGDPKVAVKGEVPDLNAINVDGFLDEGRWRFSQYIGWLGDFINLWVTDPVARLSHLASNAFRSGKARMHVNADGSILVQSVSDIVLEKVIRIPVPNRIRREDDPAGNRVDDGLKGQEYLRTWTPTGDLLEMSYQLREYARWLNSTYSLARFRQMTGDFEVPLETQIPAPDIATAFDPERTGQNQNEKGESLINYRLGYSCIRIFRDGSIMTVDAYGNSFLTNPNGIQIASTRDITLEAAGSINLIAGRDVNVLAQKNIGLTAVTEKIRIKAETGLQFLVVAGNMILETVSKTIKMLGKVNVDDEFQIDKGKVDATGQVTARMVAANVTNGPFGDQPHMFHIFQGMPSVSHLDEEFEFQQDYGGGQLYQSFAQSKLGREELPSSGSWNFSQNAVDGKGAPWPGENPSFKTTDGGKDLNVLSDSVQMAQPKPMSEAEIKLRTQQ